jgi:hypothetical protein
VVAWTILLSVIAHGLSAKPLANWYARRLRAAAPDLPELKGMSEIHSRHRVVMGHSAAQVMNPPEHE